MIKDLLEKFITNLQFNRRLNNLSPRIVSSMCGVVAISNLNSASSKVVTSLFSLQHRGQNGAGIAAGENGTMKIHRGLGLVKEIFNSEEINKLKGNFAIGHVRYPTQGPVTIQNTQPHLVNVNNSPDVCLASNGDIVNYSSERERLSGMGVSFEGTNDGELLARIIAYEISKGSSIPNAVKSVMENIRGAFSVVCMIDDKLVVFRDPWGIRPLSYGKTKDGSFIYSSETVGLDIHLISKQKEVSPGSVHVLDKNGNLEITQLVSKEEKHHCIFEMIYFARPDAKQFGESVYEFRKEIGAALAKDDKDLDVDAVFPVPDSSNVIALGYSEFSNVDFGFGLMRNHYVGRTFIAPDQVIRDEKVKEKFNPVPGFFKNKKVVLIDDSIVRGSTLKKLISMIKKAGAKEIHIRIGSPPVAFPCYYGIDTPTKEELIINNVKLENLAEYFGADSLRYLDLGDLKKLPDSESDFCDACFSGDYPLGTKEKIIPVSEISD